MSRLQRRCFSVLLFRGKVVKAFVGYLMEQGIFGATQGRCKGRREGDKFDLVDFGLCFCMDFSFVFSMFDKYNNIAIIEDNNRLIQMKRGTQFWGEFPLGIG